MNGYNCLNVFEFEVTLILLGREFPSDVNGRVIKSESGLVLGVRNNKVVWASGLPRDIPGTATMKRKYSGQNVSIKIKKYKSRTSRTPKKSNIKM